MSDETTTTQTSLLNRKGVKAFALQCSEHSRHGKFTRVSGEFMTTLEIKVRNIIREHVLTHPSNGKTIEKLYIGEMPPAASTRRGRR